ncbi:DUF4159 domain-containing protein [Chelatococcus sp. SYSU_G07232]|uniref:DUF4159 domain-containing protein n=1 Tax=Chelatococcus albus TaxID=3047466 RepID=A0ABT7AIX8_9HYPH|nr:DUF4159 domain-containing protein [Chelatococcus sp. SYSU_G07232]MDJ1159331.1 DUF4159 domain-containing protein [Chelatococcus sp. SYSU_G07232]
MLAGLPLGFAAPLVLLALAALPAIWLLLRVTPPQPRRIAFPPLRILADILPRRQTPARTPWWLVLLRLLVASLLILAAAGPVWNPRVADARRDGPLLLVLDSGFASARDWRERVALVADHIGSAQRDGRAVALVATGERAGDIALLDPGTALERLRAVAPSPHAPDRRAHLPAIGRFLAAQPDAEIVWVSDGVSFGDGAGFVTELAALKGEHPVTVHKRPRAEPLTLAGAENTAGGLDVRVLRPEANGRDVGTLRAVDLKGLPLAETRFSFAGSATEASARFVLPVEMRNAAARIEVADENSAGAVWLLDDKGKRRRVGLVSGATADTAQPLLSPTYYVARALLPFADLREPRGGVAEAVETLLDETTSVLVLADVGALDRETLQRVTRFVEEGGVLIRFAGTRLAAANDALVPVRLRRGGRSLGGTLSWETPKTLAPFPAESPFAGLATPGEISVRRQILAEPDGTLADKTWAALADGTPVVTAERRGSGLVVLFHVTADPTWSSLPLSGVFVDMLRRVVALAGKPAEVADGNGSARTETVAPQRTLDGFGAFRTPPATAKPVARSFSGRASEEHPPGFYGPNESLVAVNALAAEDRPSAIDFAPLGAALAPIAAAQSIDLRAPLLVAALVLLALDTLLALALGGHLAALTRKVTRGGIAGLALLAVALAGPPEAARAADDLPPLRREDIDSALVTRLAYVVTGDAQVDAISRAGLAGLSQALSARTALEPGEPIGVDPARDELAFYPLLYWPVVAGRPLPSDAALRRLDAYMKNGGTVIFDTRDAISLRPGGAQTPEGQQLRRMLATLDIPELEPVPHDHVLTKAFYLIDNLVGRYATGQTWVEALPPVPEGERRPARAGDGVTPVIITSNDLAAAWAVGPRGEPLYPTLGGDPRQREFAFRGGINTVMYALTGNYKADQVHVPALLERLGQ